MKILALDSSAKAASVALGEDGIVIAEYFQNCGLTHSRTLMPMVNNLLTNCEIKLSDLDCIAISSGPGSFTGLRIGMATAKGIALGANLPCCGVSTLEAMSRLPAIDSGIICCSMDARRQQVYNALFEVKNKSITRICPDRAISLPQLATDLKKTQKKIILVGDGAELCYNYLKDILPISLAPHNVRIQRASGVLSVAEDLIKRGETVSPQLLYPNYIRLSQAERERLERLSKNN